MTLIRNRPEALGVVSGCIFLITMFAFIPVPFADYIVKNTAFPQSEVIMKLVQKNSIHKVKYKIKLILQ